MSNECIDIVPSLCGKGGVVIPDVNCDGSLVIEGADDVTINQGVGIDLTDGVTAYDKNGNEIPFTVEPDEIAKCDVGEHIVTYTAIGASDEMLPHIRCGKNRMHVSPFCDSLDRVTQERVVTITQADPPVITAPSEIETMPNTDFDPLQDVSAVDDNGNEVDVTYSGTLDKMASGSIASFPDGTSLFPAKSVKVSLEPIQDLHGYDKPWSGGNGVNKCDINSVVLATSAMAYGLTVTKDTTNGSITISGTPTWGTTGVKVFRLFAQAGAYSAGYTPKAFNISTNSNVTDISLQNIGSDDYVVIKCTVSTIGDVAITLKPLFYVGAEPTQWTPYSNLCPIYGRTGCDTYVRGVNLWDEETESGSYNVTTGAPKTDASKIRAKNDVPVLPNTTYYKKTPNGFWNIYLDADKNVISYGDASQGTFTTPNNCYYIRFYLETAYGTTYNHDISINYPSTDTDYHAYHGNTYPISWQTEASTVYGADVEAVEGELVDKMGTITLDGTQGRLLANWRPREGSSAWLYPYGTPDMKASASADIVPNMLSDTLPAVAYTPIYTGTVGVSAVPNNPSWGLAVRVPVAGLDTVSAINEYLAQHPIQLCYELATPQTYTLDPTAISLYDGTNNVWSDGGDVEVVYTREIPESGTYQYPLNGEYELTYTAEDECGNQSELTVPVTVGATKRTVLYTDGTLIINERLTDSPANITAHGVEIATYDPLGATNNYHFSVYGSLWYPQRSSIRRVEIGSVIQPTWMNFWFGSLSNCTSIDLTNIDSSRLTRGRWMFQGCSALTTLDLSPLRNAHWENLMDCVFSDCYRLTALDLSGFDTSRVSDMSEMFSDCMGLESLDISSFDTSNVHNMALMFYNCQSLTALDVTNFNTEKATNMRRMFSAMYDITELDLSSFNTSRVSNMEEMFFGNKATTIYASDDFVTDAVTASSSMFQGANNLVGGAGTTYSISKVGKEYAHIDGGTSDPGYFTAI